MEAIAALPVFLLATRFNGADQIIHRLQPHQADQIYISACSAQVRQQGRAKASPPCRALPELHFSEGMALVDNMLTHSGFFLCDRPQLSSRVHDDMALQAGAKVAGDVLRWFSRESVRCLQE